MKNTAKELKEHIVNKVQKLQIMGILMLKKLQKSNLLTLWSENFLK